MKDVWKLLLSSNTDLQQAFDQAWHYFNDAAKNPSNASWDKVQSMLDEHVVLKRVTHDSPADFIPGRDKVMAYLREDCTDHPNFEPKSPVIDPILGAVYGLANWYDDNSPSKPDTIRFFFLFTKRSGSWKLIFLWGSNAIQ